MSTLLEGYTIPLPECVNQTNVSIVDPNCPRASDNFQDFHDALFSFVFIAACQG